MKGKPHTNVICRLSYSYASKFLLDYQMLKPMCSILMYGTFLNSYSILKLTIQYTLTVYSEVKVGWLKNDIEPRFYSIDKFLNANCQATLFIISFSILKLFILEVFINSWWNYFAIFMLCHNLNASHATLWLVNGTRWDKMIYTLTGTQSPVTLSYSYRHYNATFS